MSKTRVTAIIPVFNDRASLERALPVSIETLSRITPEFEIIIAEDGSTDGSTEYARDYAEKDLRVRLLHNDTRQGRGTALNRAIQEAKGAVICYYDVDLATGMQHLPELIAKIEDGADISTGSRLLPASDIIRTGGREIASRNYNLLVRVILGSRIHDHQCGFKGFRKDRVLPLLSAIRDKHWFWDTELLVRAERSGYTIAEFPVHWRAGRGTTVRMKDIFTMGSSILRLWWQIHVSEN